MIDHNKNLFLIDFGAVKEIIPNATKSQVKATQIYTLGYAPREQEYGYPRFNSDIYALGKTIIELITGLEPDEFGDDWYNKIQISDDLKSILSQMIDEDDQTRYQSAADVIKDLQTQKTIPILPTVTTSNLDSNSGNEMIMFGMLFIFIFLVILNTFMLPESKNKEPEEQQSSLMNKFFRDSRSRVNLVKYCNANINIVIENCSNNKLCTSHPQNGQHQNITA